MAGPKPMKIMLLIKLPTLTKNKSKPFYFRSVKAVALLHHYLFHFRTEIQNSTWKKWA